MSATKLEEVARAMTRATGGKFTARDYDSMARAAIETLRKPTDVMLEASSKGFAQEPSWDNPMQHYKQRAHNSFVAAIDAILKEQGQ